MRFLITLIFCILYLSQLSAQVSVNKKSFDTASSSVDFKYSIYTPYLSFVNFGKSDINTQHYEILFGYQFTQKDRIGIKLATWKLFAPMGIPIWDEKFLDRNAFYPGRLKETGVGLSYQRKLWKGLFATFEMLPLRTKYINNEGTTIAKGYKQYHSYHMGYQIPLFKNGRIFIEPQLHVNHWIINTNVPESFRNEEVKWNNYFLIEPNLYIGIRF